MTTANWIAIVTPGLVLGGIGISAIVKLTRLVDAVDRLTTAMETITKMASDHELRIGLLEQRRRFEQNRRRRA